MLSFLNHSNRPELFPGGDFENDVAKIYRKGGCILFSPHGTPRPGPFCREVVRGERSGRYAQRDGRSGDFLFDPFL